MTKNTGHSSDSKVDAFDKRAQKLSKDRISLYNDASEHYPYVREKERQIVVDQLRLSPNQDICDAGAGGAYLSEGIEKALNGKCNITCIENSRNYFDTIPARYNKFLSSLNRIELPDSTFDRIGVLAGLHHMEYKADFFGEAYRMLRTSGRLVVADVQSDTPPAYFLNGPVDKFNPIGHDGRFFNKGEMSDLCRAAGFSQVGEMLCQFDWEFPDRQTLVEYCKALFGMARASLDEVEAAVNEYLEVYNTTQGVALGWSLVTVCADKA